MSFPTAVPSPSARIENLQRKDRARRRRRFLLSLLAGQLLVLLLDLGGKALLRLLKSRVQWRGALPLESMVFIAMTSTIVGIGLLLFLYLGYKGTSYVFGEKRIGLFRALRVGFLRVWREAWALGLILGVVGGTAWFLVPREGREALKAKGRQAVEKGKGWVEKRIDALKPPPAAPSQPPR